ncbi:MAG TPA: DUF1273 domain-containing protein [Firmicutes bacterium]|nr:DUF1273 domain-containing protein [Bacillota bacterium]
MNPFIFKGRTAAFTGHRPGLLPCNGEESSPAVKRLKYDMSRAIHKAIEQGYLRFITGMAPGFDLWAAQAVLSFREIYPRVFLECAVPYRGHGRGSLYREILEHADRITVLSEQYYDGCLLARNRYLVEQSSLLIAYCVQEHGSGTGYTLRLAQKHGLDIIKINAL